MWEQIRIINDTSPINLIIECCLLYVVTLEDVEL